MFNLFLHLRATIFQPLKTTSWLCLLSFLFFKGILKYLRLLITKRYYVQFFSNLKTQSTISIFVY